ncbi:MAG: adenylate cyclase, partial [Candidatus Lokiarchaeota archaeon]|nr:adenylate cyclase [Candidatus Lokiarchaeota archaeon]
IIKMHHLTSIPDSIKKLTALEYLDLSWNKLQKLPNIFNRFA